MKVTPQLLSPTGRQPLALSYVGGASPKTTTLLPGPARLLWLVRGLSQNLPSLDFAATASQLDFSFNQPCFLPHLLVPEAAFCMLRSDSESASQKTQSVIGNGMDVKRNVLLAECSFIKHINSKNQYMIMINYNWTKLDDSERLEGVDGHCRSAEGRMVIGDVSDKPNYSIYSTHHYYSRLQWVPFPTS